MSHEAKEALIGRMREQFAQLNGRDPDAKTARAIEQQATRVAESVGAKNNERRWVPTARRRR